MTSVDYNLIHNEWHTSRETTVADRKVGFRGFFGDYRITYHLPDGDISVPYSLSSNQ